MLVLDNASRDGSAAAARRHAVAPEVIGLERRAGKGENDTALLKRARGRYALLLNEDSELQPGAVAALRDALQEREDAAAAGARLLRPDGTPQPSAWRFPTAATALVGALFLHKRFTVQSRGQHAHRRLGAVRRPARADGRRARIGVRPAFFVSDEVDFCQRLRDAGWHPFTSQARCPAPRAALDGQGAERRIVELSRNRDRYMRKHPPRPRRRRARAHGVGLRGPRARARAPQPRSATLLAHVTATLRPDQAEGLREAAIGTTAAGGCEGRLSPDRLAAGRGRPHGEPNLPLPWPVLWPAMVSPSK